MQLKDIKKVVKAMGHAVLLEEDGSGLVVVLLKDYLQLLGLETGEEVTVRRTEQQKNGLADTVSVSGEQDLLLVEKLNQDIAMLKEEIKKQELEELEDDPKETVD